MIVRFNTPTTIARAVALRLKHGSWDAVPASGIEAAIAGETVQHGSTEGESPTVATSDGDAQPQSGVNRHG